MNKENMKTAVRLTKIVAYLMSNPDLPPATISSNGHRVDFFNFPYGPAEVIRKFGAMEKVVNSLHSTLFILRKKMDDFVAEFNFQRDAVCQRVKVGETVIPAKPARTVTLDAEPEKTEEQFEWRCPESLLRDTADVLENATADAVEEASLQPTTSRTFIEPEDFGTASHP